MNALVKYLSHIPFHEIAFFRALISLILCAVWMKKEKISFKGTNTKVLILRGFAGTLALLFYFYSLQKLPLASAVVIQNLSPLFATIAAIFVLKEQTFRAQWFLIFIAFAGIILVRGFDMAIPWFNLAVGVMGALCSAIAYTFVRKLKDFDPPLRIVFYFPLTSVVLLFPILFWRFVLPSPSDLLILAAIGIVTQFAQFYMTKAYHADKASKISIFNYLGVPLSLMIGYFLFNETLDFYAMFGIILILGATTLSGILSRFTSQNS